MGKGESMEHTGSTPRRSRQGGRIVVEDAGLPVGRKGKIAHIGSA